MTLRVSYLNSDKTGCAEAASSAAAARHRLIFIGGGGGVNRRRADAAWSGEDRSLNGANVSSSVLVGMVSQVSRFYPGTFLGKVFWGTSPNIRNFPQEVLAKSIAASKIQ